MPPFFVASDQVAVQLQRMAAFVVALACGAAHQFSKSGAARLELLAGQGVAGDAHCGDTVKHRSRVKIDPAQPNLRQVHLLHAELFDELADEGFAIAPGDLGENITTRGIALLGLPTGTQLQIGPEAVIELTGLRNPCRQIDEFRPGLLPRLARREPDVSITRLAGVMSIVRRAGPIRPGDAITVHLPDAPFRNLAPV